MGEKIYDIAVIGSGAGGLAAATRASSEGASVVLLEAMPEFGGYLNPFSRRKYIFDTGLHYLGDLDENGGFRKTLQSLGIWEKMEFIELNPDGFCEYHFGNTLFRMPKGIEVFKARLIRMFPGEEKTIQSLINLILKIENAVKLSLNPKGIKNTIRASINLPFMIKLLKKTYGELIDEITNNKDIKFIFSSMSGEAGLPPDEASPFMALILLHYLKGAYYPKGGSRSFRNTFLETIKENGATLVNKAEVLRITKENDLFTLNTTRGEFRSKSIIANANPSTLFTRIIQTDIIPPELIKKAKQARQSRGAFYAFIGTTLDITQHGITDANLIHSDTNNFDYDNWDDFPYFFLTSPTIKDPHGEHAPSGYHTIEVISYAPFEAFERWKNSPSGKRGQEYKEFKHRLGMKLLRKVERYIPNLTQHLDFVEFATPLTNEYWVKAPRGGCYGLAQTPDQMGPGRFNISTGIKHLYLCGASTIAGGISPSISSGVMAANLALREL